MGNSDSQLSETYEKSVKFNDDYVDINGVHEDELITDVYWIHCKIYKLIEPFEIEGTQMKYVIYVPIVSPTRLYINDINVDVYTIAFIGNTESKKTCLLFDLHKKEGYIISSYILGNGCLY